MTISIQRIDYFYASVTDEPGEGFKVLSHLAEQGVNLLAFTGVPVGPMRVQLTLFPEDRAKFEAVARGAGLAVEGPHHALLVRGDDALGVLAGIHEKLYQARVDVYASTGVSDGAGHFGYVLYVKSDEFERAAAALEV